VIDVDSPLGQEFLNLAIGEAITEVPTDSTQDDLRFEVPLLEYERTSAHH
jgi:hypothetical protein